jgi:hypothetical protein
MNKNYILVLMLCVGLKSSAQINLSQNDFANAGDQILVSRADAMTAVDLTTTGANQTWDFSFLVPQSQDTLSFLSVGSTGTNYTVFFSNIGINSNRSNIAIANGTLPTIPGLPITLSDPYSFYYKSSTDYKQQGLGITISGFQTPIAYTSKDFLYLFPVNYNNSDSCNAAWNFSLTGLGYYGFEQKRVNHADGWGTITTPYGSFSALRIRTELYAKDTLYADTLGTGFGIERPKVVEYKWITNNQKIPILQINTTDVVGNEVVTDIIYRDSLRNVGVENISLSQSSKLYPNPAHEYSVLNFYINKSADVVLRLTDTKGSTLMEKLLTGLQPGSHSQIIGTQLLGKGIYYLSISTADKVEVKKLIVQ